MSVPATMKAVVTQSPGVVAVVDIPVPAIADDEILVKVIAAATNPTDWQHRDKIGTPGTISGCDFSGYVAKVGSKVTNVVVGEHVAGFTHGGNYTDRGAYAEYTKVSGDLVWKVPKDTLTHEEAATFGCAFWTAVQAYFQPKRLHMVEPPSKVEGEEWVFVYGGSTSVGMFALQLAKAAGYKVVTVASPKNFDLVRSFGADEVFDYRDPDVSKKINEATKNTLHLAFDTICTVETQSIGIKAFAPGPGKMIVIQPAQPEAEAIRPDVKIQHTLIYTALGREFSMFKVYPQALDDRAHMAEFLQKVPALVSAGLVKPNPTKLFEGGLNSVSEGLDYVRDGKNSGEKLVYRIAA